MEDGDKKPEARRADCGANMGHTYTQLLYHVIWSTKERRPLIDSTWQADFLSYMGGIARREFGVLHAADGTRDHVHALLSIKADTAVSQAMNRLKSLSSAWAKGHAPSFAWQGGYAAFSVSRSQEEAVREYIAGQKRHHRTQTFEEEFIAFLDRHGIEYDPRYVFD